MIKYSKNENKIMVKIMIEIDNVPDNAEIKKTKGVS